MIRRSIPFAVMVLLAGCAAGSPTGAGSSSAQSRAYPSVTGDQLMRAVAAAFLDLGYSIDRVDESTKTISASKGEVLRVTATVQPATDGATLRLSATISSGGVSLPVDAAQFYQADVFAPVDQALALARGQG